MLTIFTFTKKKEQNKIEIWREENFEENSQRKNER